MAERGNEERSWLRPLGLFVLALALAIGSPLVLIGVPLALLSFLLPESNLRSLAVGTLVLVLVFTAGAGSGLWYLERGWAVLVGAWFAAVTLAWPGWTFVNRGLAALTGGTVWTVLALTFLGGWPVADELVQERLDAGAVATLEVFGAVLGSESGDMESALRDAVIRTAEIQGVLFPALLALASLAGLGVAWWLYLRLARNSGRGLAPLRSFRFPDPLIWVLIGGISLVLLFGWSESWGRMGSNLLVLMIGLYALRGVGVVVFLTGGLTVPAIILTTLALLLVPPLVLAAAMAVGIGDSWFDIRSRGRQNGVPEG